MKCAALWGVLLFVNKEMKWKYNGTRTNDSDEIHIARNAVITIDESFKESVLALIQAVKRLSLAECKLVEVKIK